MHLAGASVSYGHISSYHCAISPAVLTSFQLLVAILYVCNITIAPIEEDLCELLADKGTHCCYNYPLKDSFYGFCKK